MGVKLLITYNAQRPCVMAPLGVKKSWATLVSILKKWTKKKKKTTQRHITQNTRHVTKQYYNGS